MSTDSWTPRVATAFSLEPEELPRDGARAVVEVQAASWHGAFLQARDDLQCEFFDWLSAVDEQETGLFMVSHVWNIQARRGILFRALLTDELVIDSLVQLYPGAAWHERETHEMFGVDFPGNDNLGPLLLPPEFQGHPLRKDFVLASRVVKEWPGEVEPGGGRPSHDKPAAEEPAGGKRPRKRAPKRPLGVPDDPEWGKIVPPSRRGGEESADG